MNQAAAAAPRPPSPQLRNALQRMRAGDDVGALEAAEAGLAGAEDRAPLLALAGLSALRAGLPARAIPHLREIVRDRPGDHASRLNLANALIETGDLEGALALARAAPDGRLARVEGFVLQQLGRHDEAVAAYRRAVKAEPGDLASWNNLANALSQSGDLDAAIPALEMAITIAPAKIEPYLNLSDVLRRVDRAEPRLKVMRDAQRIAPNDRRVLTELALAQIHADDLDSAVATLEHTVTRFPDFGESHIELGRLYEAHNRIDDMAALIARTDLSDAPPEAAFLLAWQAQREGRFDDAAQLAETIPETVHAGRRFHLIGQIADRRGDSAAAFAAFARMNVETLAEAAASDGRTFRDAVVDDMQRWGLEQPAHWTAPPPADDDRDPVFLVGFPRSGTTLLDTMLMGLPDLSVLEEKPMMAEVARTIGDRDLAPLAPGTLTELRQSYFASATKHGWNDTRWLVDKHPLNMARAPLIHRLFPQARFILAERHPYDVVLSCFMANFTPNFAMRSFTTLDEAARTYDAVFTAWERARDLFAINVREVRYERLVADPRGELAPLVEWLGLAWDNRLLAHSDTAKARGHVRTASYSQIGEPLYTRASGRWRRYAEQLSPVIPILKPWAERMGYEAA